MFDIDEFIAQCTTARQEAQPQLAVKEVVERALSRPSEIDAALGEPDSWAMRTIHHTDDLTILQFVWPPTSDDRAGRAPRVAATRTGGS